MSDLYSSPDPRLSDPSIIHIEDILAPRDAPEPAPAREGLPPTFRMRADAHYVESLDATAPDLKIDLVPVGSIEPDDPRSGPPLPALVESIRRHGVLQPLLVQGRNGHYRLLAGDKRLAAAVAAGLREVPVIVRHLDDDAAEALAAASNVFSLDEGERAVNKEAADAATIARGELARSLSALGVCASLLADSAPALTRVVAANLIRAEVWRAACLLQASSVLQGEVAIRRKPVSPHVVVDRVLESVECECRVRGVLLDRRVDFADCRIHADEELLVCALSGLLMATFGLLDSVPGAPITFTATSRAGGEVTFAVAQDAVSAPATWAAHAIEGSAVDQSGGGIATILLAARRIVERCDGRMAVTTAEGRTEMLITLPSVP